MSQELQMRLVVYEGADWLDVLPVPLSIQWANPMNDTPSLQFTYSDYEEVERSELLERLIDEQLDVAVELNWGNGWREPRSARFVIMDCQDDTSEQTHTYTFIGVGVDTDIEGIVVTDPAVYNSEGRRVFTNASPGQYLVTYLQYGKSTGQINLLDWDFTVDKASGDADWNSSITWEVAKETSARTILDTLTSYGMCNWCTDGNTLRVFVDGSEGTVSEDYGMQRDLTVGDDPVELVMGREILNGPQSRSRRNLAQRIWITSDNNATWLRTNSSTYIRRGNRTITLTQGGITTEGGAALIGDRTLATTESNREQLTRSLKIDSSVAWLPVKDYRPGDWIYAPGKRYGALERLRVRQITLEQDEQGIVTGSIILNDRLLERSVAQQKALQAIGNGAVIAGGGAATRPPAKNRVPAKIAGTPTVSSSAYIDSSGHIRAIMQIQWAGVTSGVDGQAIEVDHYEVRIRKRKN